MGQVCVQGEGCRGWEVKGQQQGRVTVMGELNDGDGPGHGGASADGQKPPWWPGVM
jgi:hypothetical protein